MTKQHHEPRDDYLDDEGDTKPVDKPAARPASPVENRILNLLNHLVQGQIKITKNQGNIMASLTGLSGQFSDLEDKQSINNPKGLS